MVSFTPSAERLALTDSAARMLRERYADHQQQHFEAARWREFAALGWLAACVDEQHGGVALAWSTASALCEALAPAVAPEPLAAQLALVGHVLNQARPGAARDDALEAWLAGEHLLALAHGEDDSPPWLSEQVQTRCTRDADGYVLNGHKRQVLDAALASQLLVTARDTSGALAVFVLARDMPGLTLSLRDSIDGRSHADVRLTAVRVDTAMRLEFARDTVEVLAQSAWLHALLQSAEALGLLAAMLRASHEYLVQRQQFGQALIEFQALQHRLVDMLLTLSRLESLLEVARCQCDAHGPVAAAPYIAAVKAACGEEGRALARQAVQLHGAIGVTAELALAAQMRRLMALEMLGGSTAQHADYWMSTLDNAAHV